MPLLQILDEMERVSDQNVVDAQAVTSHEELIALVMRGQNPTRQFPTHKKNDPEVKQAAEKLLSAFEAFNRNAATEKDGKSQRAEQLYQNMIDAERELQRTAYDSFEEFEANLLQECQNAAQEMAEASAKPLSQFEDWIEQCSKCAQPSSPSSQFQRQEQMEQPHPSSWASNAVIATLIVLLVMTIIMLIVYTYLCS